MEQQQISYHFKTNWKEILFFIFLWFLLYIEPITIGPLKISQIWKAIVVVGMFVYLLPKKIPSFIYIGYLFAFKYLIYTYMPYGYLTAIQNTLEAMIFPLFLGFFYIKYKNRPDATEQLIHIAILLSLFFIFSSVPFLFGIQSLNPVSELDKYGIERTAMKGLFYSIAGSSKMYTIATIILFNTYKRFSNSIFNKGIWLAAILLGTYFVYASWTRTGWFIYLITLFFSFFYKSNLKQKVLAIALSFMLLFGLIRLYDTNQAFRYRLTGGAVYRQDTELSVDQLADARLPFIFVAIDNLKGEGFFGQLFGYGTEHGIDLFKQKIGMAIVSHNRTFEILEASGFLGLILYFIFIGKTTIKTKKIFRYIPLELQKLSFITGLLYFGFILTSHGAPIFGEIAFAAIIIGTILYNNNSIYGENSIR